MITIHEKTAQTFDTIGLGTLVPGSCIVTEELNGAYELELKHPYDDGGKWKRIERGRILYASTPRGMQPFRIYYVKTTSANQSATAALQERHWRHYRRRLPTPCPFPLIRIFR